MEPETGETENKKPGRHKTENAPNDRKHTEFSLPIPPVTGTRTSSTRGGRARSRVPMWDGSPPAGSQPCRSRDEAGPRCEVGVRRQGG